jgi:hypothetical protein
VLFCVMCLIAVPLPPGANPFAVQINNNNNNNNNNSELLCKMYKLYQFKIRTVKALNVIKTFLTR